MPRQPLKTSAISRPEIRDALQRSGYLLEFRVYRTLLASALSVTPSWAYPDPQTGKARELDLRAHGYHQEIAPEAPDSVMRAELLIECVHPPQPVAFFVSDRQRRDMPLTRRIQVAGHPIQVPDKQLAHNWSWLLETDLRCAELHHHASSGTFAHQFCSFERKRSNDKWYATRREEDHDSFKKLIDATNYLVRAHYQGMDPAFHAFQLVFFFPVLVVQGTLLQVSVHERGLSLTEVEHIRYIRPSADTAGEAEYHIDVVTEEYLPSLLSMIIHDMQGLRERTCHRAQDIWDIALQRRRAFLQRSIAAGASGMAEDSR